MPTPIMMPKLTSSMKEGLLVAWLASEGERVRKGQPLYQVETDKAVQEVEAPMDGVLVRIVHGAGAKVPVNTAIAMLE